MNSILEKVLVAKIVSKNKHPNADNLYLVMLDVGDLRYALPQEIFDVNGTIQVVTGANNFDKGDLVAYLPPGNIVPGWFIKNGKEIKLESKEIRGILSHGMILAEDEIGVGEDHSGIFLVNDKNPKVDQSVFSEKNEINSFLGKSLVKVLSKEVLESVSSDYRIMESKLAEIQKKIDLIKRDLFELVGEEELKQILLNRNLRVYWGTAPTGKPSIGYFLPMIKVSDLLRIGAEVTILFANIHAYLDNMKSKWEVLEYRTQYYQILIKSILQRLGASIDKLKFVVGTDFQLTPDYTLDMYKIATLTTIASAKGAGSEVVKQVENPVLGSMLYPILQALDEQYLNVDAQLGGLDQRKIFMFARESLPKIGYKKRVHMLHQLIPGLGKSGKMSSSDPDSKIDFEDSDEVIYAKFNKAYSEDKKVEGNCLLAILRYILFYFLELEGRPFVVERPQKWGGDVAYLSYWDLEKDFESGKLSSVDLKPAIAKEVIKLISPIRETLLEKKDIIEKAYQKL
ncbi:tyrosine--tRNA ligase [Candidatus Dojkabacteria bacterium]|uniref:Tyrosine--tRNA ligase n=1 Tax=Candidatus Dojkabacteria bacterium TaxID=2099670 RepID=A0A3M0Z1H4_9BACT|nr:MAG: tyrosine--tRNA ligase [Candidatus Dojkabacteria bacterium]